MRFTIQEILNLQIQLEEIEKEFYIVGRCVGDVRGNSIWKMQYNIDFMLTSDTQCEVLFESSDHDRLSIIFPFDYFSKTREEIQEIEKKIKEEKESAQIKNQIKNVQPINTKRRRVLYEKLKKEFEEEEI